MAINSKNQASLWKLPDESQWALTNAQATMDNAASGFSSEIYDALAKMKTIEKDEWLKGRFVVWRDYVKHEDGLINNRITWFIALSSFLIAAFGLVLTNAISTLYSKSIELSGSHALFVSIIFAAFLGFIAVVGIQTAYSTYFSVMAASNAIRNLGASWSLLLFRLSNADVALSKVFEALPGITGGGDTQNNELGFSIAARLPKLMHTLWRFLFILPLALLGLGIFFFMNTKT